MQILLEKGSYVLLYVLIMVGCWFIATSFIPLPSSKAMKAFRSFSAEGEKKVETNAIDAFISNFSKKFAHLISLDSIKRSEMKKQLYLINSPRTPEEHVAYMATTSIMVAIVGLLLIPLSKLITAILFILAVGFYIYNSLKLKQDMKKSVMAFEMELPRFVAYLKQAFMTKANVLNILENYTTKNEAFGEELIQTLADAKTSNFDAAMARLDQRINSDRLKTVIRGLISAYHGEDVVAYFAMLERDFTAFEINDLKKLTKSIPQKMAVPKLLIVLIIMVIFFFPLIMTVIDQLAILKEVDASPNI